MARNIIMQADLEFKCGMELKITFEYAGIF